MISPWRAATLAAFVALCAVLGVASFALAQPAPPAASDPPPPPPTVPKAATPALAIKDPFGVEVTLTPKTIIFMKGNSTWDKALDNLQDAFKSVYSLIDRTGLAKAGPAMTIYT